MYEIVGGAGSEREAAERWFGHSERSHDALHRAAMEDFAESVQTLYSQTPYTPEPGYLLIVREAGSPSSTGTYHVGISFIGAQG